MDDLKIQIKEFVCNHLIERAQLANVTISDIEDSMDMLESGLLDSMGFVDLMVSVEGAFDVQIEFGERDPSEFTVLSGFLDCVVKE